ncbi:cytochrome P450 [Paralimibaculum aggregatum]|uniref:Cytochrome P450 n=1 Tax=Paralimibaculum aggregatum TaxID=3036245 RepID=A0ABQ6LQS0_9RHOB|nr:cytochrome P450 [Limibaculum sp. NKW23]GMG83543.1 cytochrome P450 [Limibaculum sp. NKW23]
MEHPIVIDSAPFLDPSDPAFSVRSAEVEAARARSWYARTPFGIAVLRYDAMKAMILHPALRQGSHRWPEHNGCTGLWAAWWKRIMLNREGPDHARLRRLGAPAFAPRLVSDLVPRFQALADELVAGFEARGECEFMAEFAEPYAARVICALIGLDERHWRELADLTVDMGLALGVTYAREEARIDAATEAMFAFARSVVAARRAAPREDFIGTLIAASAEAGRLAEQELLDMVVLSIFGGIDTTRNQLGLAMQCFLENPAQWALLGARPELARQAVEEVMRVRPTTTWVTREAVEDFEFAGLAIPAGTTIHLFSGCAGTDPARFAPGFDITAERARHFGFGGGKHHCIGSPIARGDMTEALRLLAGRLRNLSPGDGAAFLPDSGNTGPVRLPLRFDPAG